MIRQIIEEYRQGRISRGEYYAALAKASDRYDEEKAGLHGKGERLSGAAPELSGEEEASIEEAEEKSAENNDSAEETHSPLPTDQRKDARKLYQILSPPAEKMFSDSRPPGSEGARPASSSLVVVSPKDLPFASPERRSGEHLLFYGETTGEESVPGGVTHTGAGRSNASRVNRQGGRVSFVNKHNVSDATLLHFPEPGLPAVNVPNVDVRDVQAAGGAASSAGPSAVLATTSGDNIKPVQGFRRSVEIGPDGKRTVTEIGSDGVKRTVQQEAPAPPKEGAAAGASPQDSGASSAVAGQEERPAAEQEEPFAGTTQQADLEGAAAAAARPMVPSLADTELFQQTKSLPDEPLFEAVDESEFSVSPTSIKTPTTAAPHAGKRTAPSAQFRGVVPALHSPEEYDLIPGRMIKKESKKDEVARIREKHVPTADHAGLSSAGVSAQAEKSMLAQARHTRKYDGVVPDRSQSPMERERRRQEDLVRRRRTNYTERPDSDIDDLSPIPKAASVLRATGSVAESRGSHMKLEDNEQCTFTPAVVATFPGPKLAPFQERNDVWAAKTKEKLEKLKDKVAEDEQGARESHLKKHLSRSAAENEEGLSRM